MALNWSLQNKRDTAANWTANNPTLLEGQLGVETDDLLTAPKFKIGDGVTDWNTLPYFYGGLASAQDLNNVLSVGNSTNGQNINVNTNDSIQIGNSSRIIWDDPSLITSALNIQNVTGNNYISLSDNGTNYSGGNWDITGYELKAGQTTLEINPTGIATVGTTQWNDTIGSSETTLKGGNVVLKNGIDLVARVVNKVTPAITLTKSAYQVVKISGAQGQRLAIDLAKADTDNNSADTLGLVIETISPNKEGFIMCVGQLSEIDTTGSLQSETWADGDVLYLSPTVKGAITNVKPNGSTGHIVVIGYVEYAHAIHGSIYVKIMNGWELDELHNVYINPSTLANNDILTYESSTSLWKNKTVASILGYTPQPLASNLTSWSAANPYVTGFTSFTSSGTPLTGEPNYFLSTITAPTGNQYNIRSTYTVNSSANNSAYRIGGVMGETYIHASNTGQLGWAVGTYGYIQNYGTGTIVRAIGSFNIVANKNGATITNAYGDYAKTENDLGGIISVNAGFYADTPSNSGTITTNYGVYISAQAGIGSTNYALYSAGASDSSYFAGSVTVNTALTSSTVTNTPSLVGTSVSGISYKGTTGNPTATDAAHLFLGGNNGATEIIRFLNNGNIRIPNARVIQGMDSAGTYRDLFTWSGGDNISINGRPGTTDISINPTSGGTALVVKSTGDSGFGVASPSAKLHILKTAEQLRVGYDTSNYYSTTVGANGVVTFNAVGTGSKFVFSDNIELTQTVTTESVTSDRTVTIVINGTTYKLLAKA